MLGTKEKYWFHIDNQEYLFKIGRPGTGENWAEKIAAELAGLLGLPHAEYNFASWKGRKGVLSPQMVPEGGRLVHGNELLAAVHKDYPKQKDGRVSDHTLKRIVALLRSQTIGFPPGWSPPNPAIKTAFHLFLGYLLLDVWISNQDRHHENWGIIRTHELLYLAPTYDHAASMGQNETDETRHDRLTSKDQGRQISNYIKRARSAIFETNRSKKPMLTLELFQKAIAYEPEIGQIWLDQLRQITENSCQDLFDRLPPSEASILARQFALELLICNRQRLLEE